MMISAAGYIKITWFIADVALLTNMYCGRKELGIFGKIGK